MSERRLGIPARVSFDHPPSGRGLEPRRVEHLQLGITWDVTGILDRWAHPGRAEDTAGKPVLIKWWLLKVSGPLPGRPGERGKFVVGQRLRPPARLADHREAVTDDRWPRWPMTVARA